MEQEIKDTDIEIPKDTAGEHCFNCRYWFELKETEEAPDKQMPLFGKCKKNPPAMLVQDDKTYSGHPITGENDWCGAWGQKATALFNSNIP